MLKHTCVNFELTDIDMVLFIERGIRGGLSQCSNRNAQTNNKNMQYDPLKSSTYLMYFDINNLYSWAICQPLSNDINRFDTSNYVIDNAYDIPLVNTRYATKFPGFTHGWR